MMIKTWRENNQEKSKLRTVVEDNIIEWTFSTPLASHHNGVVECMVKSVKNTLNKIVKGRILTEEEYRTVFAEVTKCVNSRPLWPSSNGDVEQPPITCIGLLRPGGLPRDPDSLNVTCHPRKRYHQIQVKTDGG